MNLFRKISTIVFALALLVGALGVSATPVYADGPVVDFGGGTCETIENNPPTVIFAGTSFPNTNVFQVEFGKPADGLNSGKLCEETITDSRGSGPQTYYFMFVSDSVGTTGPSFPYITFAGTAYLFSSYGDGHQSIRGSATTSDRFLTYGWQAPGSSAADWKASIYISSTPINVLDTRFYIDSTETDAGASTWVANIPYFIDAMNQEMSDEGLNKRFAWNNFGALVSGTITTNQDSEPWTSICNNPYERGLKIWFSSTGGSIPAAGGYSDGRDCDNYGATEIQTGDMLTSKGFSWSGVLPSSGTTFNALLAVALHEFEHTRGGYLNGVEAYAFALGNDYSDQIPTFNINKNSLDDPWWRGITGGAYAHSNLKTDYMAAEYSIAGSTSEFLSNSGFDELSRDFINDDLGLSGNLLDSFRYIQVRQVDENGNGVSGVHVHGWFMPIPISTMGGLFNACSEIRPDYISLSETGNTSGDYVTDANGYATLPWNNYHFSVGTLGPESQCWNMVVIKSYTSSSMTTQYGLPDYVDVYNLQLKRFQDGIFNTYAIDLLPKTANHKVTFNSNGGTGTMAVQENWVPTALHDNAFQRNGYLFTGWNTSDDGMGIGYSDQDTYAFDADVTLYAQWAVDGYMVTFMPNGATGEMEPQISKVETTLNLSTFIPPAGTVFKEWTTNADGTGDHYLSQALYPFTSDLTLYAQWLPLHTAGFNSNGGSGSMDNQVAGVPTNLNANTFTYSGHVFMGWSTSPSGGISYYDQASFPFSADATLYAVWGTTVTFNANGGTGSITPETHTPGVYMLTPNNGQITRTNYDFIGWNTNANGSGDYYTDADYYDFGVNQTLYAQWTPHSYESTFNGIGASSGWTRSDGTTGGSYIIAGDNNLNQSYRGIIDFDTSPLPDNAVIDSASLQLTKASFTGSIQGWGPTEHVNSVTVQIGNPCIGACSTLEASDYTAILGTVGYACAAQVPPCGNMTTTTDFIGSLTNISLTGHTNIRLRFNTPTDSDGINDYTSWYKNTAGGGTPPILTITYHIP